MELGGTTQQRMKEAHMMTTVQPQHQPVVHPLISVYREMSPNIVTEKGTLLMIVKARIDKTTPETTAVQEPKPAKVELVKNPLYQSHHVQTVK